MAVTLGLVESNSYWAKVCGKVSGITMDVNVLNLPGNLLIKIIFMPMNNIYVATPILDKYVDTCQLTLPPGLSGKLWFDSIRTCLVEVWGRDPLAVAYWAVSGHPVNHLISTSVVTKSPMNLIMCNYYLM